MNAAKASYSYTLSPTGNRTAAVESSGRTLNWSYDGIYRLTNETISLDPHSVNGSVGYGLDPVGNRQSQTSSIPGVGTGSFTYDPDDRLNTETYDPNGNTLTTAGKTFAYDFENRLKSMTEGSVAVTIEYDADGNRVAKTVNGVTTRYLVDDLNPTGYAQVVEEVTNGAVSRQYTYGLQRISQTQQIANAWTPTFYGYDGGGTVRLLTDSTGTVTDTYDYDAWGNTVNITGSTPNVFLYRGEQYDSDFGLQYLRTRYFNPVTGRFLTRDPAVGQPAIPSTFQKYLYAAADPANRIDPSGRANMQFYATTIGWDVPAASTLGVATGAAIACSGGYMVTALSAAMISVLPGYEVTEFKLTPWCMFTYTVTQAVPKAIPVPFNNSQPPGDCTWAEEQRLEALVHAACDGGPRSCRGVREKWEVIWRLQRNTACYNARLALMAKCFRGGDAIHQAILLEVAKVLSYCALLLDAIENGLPMPPWP
jgi:RHS repeat-associated protein